MSDNTKFSVTDLKSKKSKKVTHLSSFNISNSCCFAGGGGGGGLSSDSDSDADSEFSYITAMDIPTLEKREKILYSEKENKIRKLEIIEFVAALERLELLKDTETYAEQKMVSLQLVKTYKNRGKIIQLVIGKTQAGKTGCMTEFIKAYINDEQIPIDNIYIITGLSSKDWIAQMKDRCPEIMHKRIFHNSDINTKFKKAIEENGTKNILILIDEVHMAAQKNQTISKMMSDLKWTLDKMMENDIKIVQFSATPDGLIFALKKWPKYFSTYFEVHTMQTGSGYYGAKEMLASGKIKQYLDICGKDHNGKILVENMDEIHQNILSILKDILSFTDPRYHIFRVRGRSASYVEENIRHTIKHLLSPLEQEQINLKFDKYMQDGAIVSINDHLSRIPSKHTIILIKEKLKCANTLQNKQNIGVMIERWKEVANDSLVIQGLLGRCCGYLNHDIICYTNIDTINKYEDLFDSNFDETELENICWNSNTTFGSKNGGTRPKATFIDAKEIIDSKEETNADTLTEQQKKDKKEAEKLAKEQAKEAAKLAKEAAKLAKNQEKEVKRKAKADKDKLKDKWIGGIDFFQQTDSFAESDAFIRNIMVEKLELPEEEVKTTSDFFGKHIVKDKESQKYKCAIVGGKSIVQTLDALKATQPMIANTPGGWFGGGLETAKEIGWGIHLYYGYKEDELWYGVRWVKKVKKDDSDEDVDDDEDVEDEV